MALEGVKSDKSEENNGNVPDGKGNGTDNKTKQVFKIIFISNSFDIRIYKFLYSKTIDIVN